MEWEETKNGVKLEGVKQEEVKLEWKDTEEEDQDQAVKMESEEEGEIDHYKINSAKNINNGASDELFLVNHFQSPMDRASPLSPLSVIATWGSPVFGMTEDGESPQLSPLSNTIKFTSSSIPLIDPACGSPVGSHSKVPEARIDIQTVEDQLQEESNIPKDPTPGILSNSPFHNPIAEHWDNIIDAALFLKESRDRSPSPNSPSYEDMWVDNDSGNEMTDDSAPSPSTPEP